MPFRLLTRGGIYIVFILVVLGQWIFRRMNAKKKADEVRLSDDEYTSDNPLRDLSHPDWHFRLGAIHLLAEYQDIDNIPDLINCLDDSVYDVRQAAANALIAHGHDVVNVTIQVLDTGSLEAREMAVYVLASFPTEPSITALEQVLLHDESAWVRIPVAKALGNMANPSVVPSLVQALEDNHRDVYDAVVVALNQIGTLEALEAIKEHPYQDQDKRKKSDRNSGDDLLELS